MCRSTYPVALHRKAIVIKSTSRPSREVPYVSKSTNGGIISHMGDGPEEIKSSYSETVASLASIRNTACRENHANSVCPPRTIKYPLLCFGS